MRRKETDERVIEQNRKVMSEVYTILFYALLISVVVQQFVFHAPFEQYAVEFFCFLGASVYTLIRQMVLGIDVFGRKRPKLLMLLNCSICALTITVINGIRGYLSYADKYEGHAAEFIASLVITFISAFAASFGVLFLISALNKKRQSGILAALDEDEVDV